MRLTSWVFLTLLILCCSVNAKPMGLEKSEEIISLGKVIKIDKQKIEKGDVTLDFWYVTFQNSLYYCVTNRGTELYIECYDKNPLN
jgi:hypothetical protein